MMIKKRIFSCDFETTTDPNDCRVWAFGIVDIDNLDNFTYGISIDGFMEYLTFLPNSLFYFHNEKFDGEFIINYLFRNGYEYIRPIKGIKSRMKKGQFSTMISDMGQFYSITIQWGEKSDQKAEIRDSLKIIPMSVEKIPAAFGFEKTNHKLKLDYDTFRPKGYQLKPYEVDYLKEDCIIVAKALKIMRDSDMLRLTTASNAVASFKRTLKKKDFERYFPKCDYDEDIRQAYKGAFTYLKKGKSEQDIGEGLVLDVNGLYSWAMYYKPTPYGEGKFFEGKYKHDRNYPLYIQMLELKFELKEGYLPTIQLKHSLSFCPTEYLESSGGDSVVMCVTCVDLELIMTHYHVTVIEYISGWKFKASDRIYRPYIDYWQEEKAKATREGNKGKRTIAKLMLNALYGRLAKRPFTKSKIPFLGEDGIVHYKLSEPEETEGFYIPAGCFITAWARWKTITSAQKVYDRFDYSDTDSLHLEGLEIPTELEISDYELGKWKVESVFNKARFLRAKSYIENERHEVHPKKLSSPKIKMFQGKLLKRGYSLPIDGKAFVYHRLKVTCAGLPARCYKYVNWDNFHGGTAYGGKLTYSHVPNGIILKETTFKLKL